MSRKWRIAWDRLGIAVVTTAGLVLVAIPGVFAASDSDRSWWWPTWWMLAPLLVLLVGIAFMVIERRKPEHSPSEPVRPPIAHASGEGAEVDLEDSDIHSDREILRAENRGKAHGRRLRIWDKGG